MSLGFIGDTKDPYISLLVPVCQSVYVAYQRVVVNALRHSLGPETWHTLYHVSTKTIKLERFMKLCWAEIRSGGLVKTCPQLKIHNAELKVFQLFYV